MSEPIKLDLDQLEEVARKATPGPWWIDSHGHTMISEQSLDVVFQHNDTGEAVRHAETGNLSHWRNDWDATFIAQANPATMLELIRQLRAAQALVAARVEEIPVSAKMVMVFTDLIQRHELRDQLEEFAEAVKKRCTSGQWSLVGFFPADTSIQTMDAEQMSAAGLARIAPPPKPAPKCQMCDDDLCGGTGIYDGRPCIGTPF